MYYLQYINLHTPTYILIVIELTSVQCVRHDATLSHSPVVIVTFFKSSVINNYKIYYYYYMRIILNMAIFFS